MKDNSVSMENITSDDLGRSMRLQHLKTAMLFLLILQVAVSIGSSLFGNLLADWPSAQAIVEAMDRVVPAVRRIGGLSTDPQIGTLTYALGMIASIPIGCAFFIYGLVFRTSDELRDYLSRMSSSQKLKAMLGLAMGTSVLFTDFGVIDFVGLATAKGIYDHPQFAYTRLFHSGGFQFGLLSSVFCLATSLCYAMIFISWIRIFVLLGLGIRGNEDLS